MEHAQYQAINNEADIQVFQNVSNSLHDGYITHVAYNNSGVSAHGNGLSFDYSKISLVLHVLVTSLPDHPTFELIFQNILEWQVKDYLVSDMIGFSILFLENGLLLWADDVCSDIALLKQGCYVIAESIHYRKLP